jgi:hypothetical protein
LIRHSNSGLDLINIFLGIYPLIFPLTLNIVLIVANVIKVNLVTALFSNVYSVLVLSSHARYHVRHNGTTGFYLEKFYSSRSQRTQTHVFCQRPRLILQNELVQIDSLDQFLLVSVQTR